MFALSTPKKKLRNIWYQWQNNDGESVKLSVQQRSSHPAALTTCYWGLARYDPTRLWLWIKPGIKIPHLNKYKFALFYNWMFFKLVIKISSCFVKNSIYFWVINSSFILESPAFLEATPSSSTLICSGFVNRNQSRMEQEKSLDYGRVSAYTISLIQRNVAFIKQSWHVFFSHGFFSSNEKAKHVTFAHISAK